jgi:hypothetical protein
MSVVEFQLAHPAGLRVTQHLTEAQLIAVMPAVEASTSDMGTGWVWYRLPAFPDADVSVVVSLAFNRGVLEEISLADASPRYGANWNDWSEERERARAASIGAWLSARGFPAGSYSWGQVWWGYDAKGGGGSAAVRFTRNVEPRKSVVPAA